jgi:mono/diheme cytochrome c family protein
MKSLRVLVGAMLLGTLAPALPAMAADGKAVWAEHCQFCHGPDGKANTSAGQALGVPELKHSASLSMITTVIKHGEGHMPKLGNKLSADEIAAVAKYTQQLSAGK